jgi:hypothetical protein
MGAWVHGDEAIVVYSFVLHTDVSCTYRSAVLMAFGYLR